MRSCCAVAMRQMLRCNIWCCKLTRRDEPINCWSRRNNVLRVEQSVPYDSDMTTATSDASAWRPQDTLANRVRLVRSTIGISQREGALRIGISPRVWQGLEEGRSVRDAHRHIAAIADAFGVDRDWLLWGGPLDAETPEGPIGPGDGPDEGCPQQGSNLRPADYKGVETVFSVRQLALAS